MKHMKKLSGLLLALVMVLAMLPTAAALSDTCKVTFVTFGSGVSTVAEGDVTTANQFKGYKLLNLSVSLKCEEDDASHTHGSACYNYAYTFNDKYKAELIAVANANITDTSKKIPTGADANAYDQMQALQNYLKTLTTDKKTQAFAHSVYESIKGKDADATTTADPFNDSTANIAHGYWLFVDTTAYTGDHYSRSLYLLDTKGLEQIKVDPKQDVPEVKKYVSDTETVGTGKYTDVNVGDTVYFELVGTLSEQFANFAEYEYIFHDTLSAGLTYNGDARVYVRNGSTDTEINATTATGTQTGDSCNLHVRIADLLEVSNVTITKDSQIVAKYSATVNENAVTGNGADSNANDNRVYLEYSNEYTGAGTGKTPEDQVKVFTYELDVKKTNTDDEALSGAEFQLYRMVSSTAADGTGTTSKEWVQVDEDGVVTGWLAEADVDDDHQPSTLISDADGEIVVKGLDAGTYYLVETKAPTGYNLLRDPVEFTISATYSDNKVNTLTLTSGATENAGNTTTGVVSLTVINKTGAELPSTGGMGTTLFYVLGSAMVAAAGILLVTRRRMRNQ